MAAVRLLECSTSDVGVLRVSDSAWHELLRVGGVLGNKLHDQIIHAK